MFSLQNKPAIQFSHYGLVVVLLCGYMPSIPCYRFWLRVHASHRLEDYLEIELPSCAGVNDLT